MQYEFRGRTVQEAVRNLLQRKDQQPFSDRQVQRCRIIDAEIQRLNEDIDSAVATIASVSDDVKSRIEALGNQDTTAMIGLAFDAASLVFGLGALYRLARGVPTIANAAAASFGIIQGTSEFRDIIVSIDSISPKLDAIREGIEISEPRQKLKSARDKIEYSKRKLGELSHGYKQNQCQLVFDTFGR